MPEMQNLQTDRLAAQTRASKKHSTHVYFDY